MQASEDGERQLKALVGLAPGDLMSIEDLAAIHQRIAESRNPEVLIAFYVNFAGDSRAIFSTPAWYGLTGWTSGRMALIHDQVCFFYEPLFSSEGRLKFVAPKDCSVTWSRILGAHSCVLRFGEEKHRVSLTPPRGSDLTEVAGSPEGPGISGVLDLFADKAPFLEALSLAGEAVSMWRSARIAKVHEQMWREVFGRLSTGGSFPFDEVTTGEAEDDSSRRAVLREPVKAEHTVDGEDRVELRATTSQGGAPSSRALKLPSACDATMIEWTVADRSVVASGAVVALAMVDGTQKALLAPTSGVLRRRAQVGALYNARHVIAVIDEAEPAPSQPLRADAPTLLRLQTSRRASRNPATGQPLPPKTRTTLRLPQTTSGTVIDYLVQPGERVVEGTPVVRITLDTPDSSHERDAEQVVFAAPYSGWRIDTRRRHGTHLTSRSTVATLVR